MGRGRAKGKKLPVTNQDDGGSGEEEKIPVQKKRGRPLKPLKDDNETRKTEDEDSSEDTSGMTNKDEKSKTASLKRKRNAQVTKEKADSVKEENGNGTTTEDSKVSSGFRQYRNRRKSKPRRAAESVLECN